MKYFNYKNILELYTHTHIYRFFFLNKIYYILQFRTYKTIKSGRFLFSYILWFKLNIIFFLKNKFKMIIYRLALTIKRYSASKIYELINFFIDTLYVRYIFKIIRIIYFFSFDKNVC